MYIILGIVSGYLVSRGVQERDLGLLMAGTAVVATSLFTIFF
jgi:hypothetical protein